MTRFHCCAVRTALKTTIILSTLLLVPGNVRAQDRSRTNVLMITFDDMNFDSLGCTGCPIPGISPNVDRLAREGTRFVHAHVTIAVCQSQQHANALDRPLAGHGQTGNRR